MEYVNGCTFGHISVRGFTKGDDWKESFDLMRSSTHCDTMVLCVSALQDHTYSTRVDYETPDVMSMEDVACVCRYAKAVGMRVSVKAMVNCRDGYWRAYIRFFETHVPCEPSWAEWFLNYGTFVLTLAETAEKYGADMFCVGCEMVGADHREADWRRLVSGVRVRFSGPVTYNCDKYQEEHIRWWDALDAISSSGYYPVNALEENFRRIQSVCERTGKPFFFMECGCTSREGSEFIPNDWRHPGAVSPEAQARWYEAFTSEIQKKRVGPRRGVVGLERDKPLSGSPGPRGRRLLRVWKANRGGAQGLHRSDCAPGGRFMLMPVLRLVGAQGSIIRQWAHGFRTSYRSVNPWEVWRAEALQGSIICVGFANANGFPQRASLPARRGIITCHPDCAG